jgi:hypothetical protein
MKMISGFAKFFPKFFQAAGSMMVISVFAKFFQAAGSMGYNLTMTSDNMDR